jgi:hypothetical protein
VLHFFEDLNVVMKRVHELLKPGGLFISETVCLGDKSKTTGKILRFAGSLGLLPKMNLLTLLQVEQALQQAGFSLLEKKIYGESNREYTLIAKKP